MINEYYQLLNTNYLFVEIEQRIQAYLSGHPGKHLIRLGIGDVTLPLMPAVVEALHSAVDEMSRKQTFRGYGPSQGYDFLRKCIAQYDYQAKQCDISQEEIFISDGAKSDAGNIQELFGKECQVAVCDPVYPVYLDSNIMAGRNVARLPCRKENGFLPELPKQVPQLIYLCYPNNPTGIGMKKQELQIWVDYANKNGSIIIYDTAYEAYVKEEELVHSIFECEGARSCAIELRSFSKCAGFTGLRLGATVIPKDLKREGRSLHAMWKRRAGTKYNGAPYIVQRAGEAVYSEKGQLQMKEQIGYYMRNANFIQKTLKAKGFEVYGGVNAPYVWMKIPKGRTSWEFFDELLETANVVGTPGAGFGKEGEGYFRLTGFASYEDTKEAVQKILI